MKNLILILSVFLFFSCEKKDRTIIRENEPDVHVLDNDDVEMNKAIKEANETIVEFDKALSSNNPDFSDFSLKMKFDTKKGWEHIWISEVHIKNGKYYGVVSDVPVSIPNLKLGDSVEIPKNKISDWMFLIENKLRGGYTIKVLRSRMNKTERKKMDKETNILYE